MVLLAQENRPLSAKMIRNVAFGGVRALLVAPVPFLMTPLILSRIGTRGYGTWAVLATMNSLTSLADLGLLGTLSKYVAEYYAHRDFVQLNSLLNTGFAVFAGLASLIVVLFWIASSTVVRLLFRGSALTTPDLLFLFHCSLVLIWLNLVTFLSSSVTSGLQRLDITNVMAAFNVVFGALAGAFFLLKGWGVRGLLYGNISSAALTLLIYSLLVRRLVPELTMNPLLAKLDEAKKIFAFSWRVYLVQAASGIQNHFEKIVLALFVGVVPVGWYDIASDTALKIRGVPALLLSPVLPAAAELDARGEKAKLVELYYRTHKYLGFLAVPLVFFGVTVSARFVELWIGPSLKFVALPLSILLVVNLISLMTGPGYMIFVGQGLLWQGVRSVLVGLALGLPLSVFLIFRYGFAGAVTGTSISSLTASILFVYLFHKETGNSLARLLSEAYMKPVLCSIVLLLVEFIVSPAIGLSWLGLAVQGCVFAIFYATLMLVAGFFDDYDWERIEGVLPIARLAKRILPVA